MFGNIKILGKIMFGNIKYLHKTMFGNIFLAILLWFTSHFCHSAINPNRPLETFTQIGTNKKANWDEL